MMGTDYRNEEPMSYTIEISHAFQGVIDPALDDASTYIDWEPDGHDPDEYLVRLALVAQALRQGFNRKITRTGTVVELDEVGLEVLREEAVYRMEWANENAAFEHGGDRMRWFGLARSARAMINRVDKLTA